MLNNKNYQAAIFDFDGTIVNTIDDLQLTLNHVLDSFHFPQRTYAQTMAIVGHGVPQLIRDGANRPLTDVEHTDMYEEFLNYYAIHSDDNAYAYAGIEDLLRDLKTAGIKIACVSNKEDAALHRLVESHFEDLFDVVCGPTLGTRPKPAPDMLVSCLNVLEMSAKDCVYVGDSEVDIQFAGAAGLDCISVSWGFRSKEELKSSGANCIIDTVGELEKVLCGELI